MIVGTGTIGNITNKIMKDKELKPSYSMIYVGFDHEDALDRILLCSFLCDKKPQYIHTFQTQYFLEKDYINLCTKVSNQLSSTKLFMHECGIEDLILDRRQNIPGFIILLNAVNYLSEDGGNASLRDKIGYLYADRKYSLLFVECNSEEEKFKDILYFFDPTLEINFVTENKVSGYYLHAPS